MSRLMKLRCLNNVASSILFKKSQVQMQQTLNRHISYTKPLLAGFAKDYKPGPYPKTEAERIAAAKKYGLKPEDYKPFPDDGMGFGDYPMMPNISTDMKSNWEDYDDPYLRRNFGEPMHIFTEQILADKVTLDPGLVSLKQIAFGLFLGAGLFFGLVYLTYDFKWFMPVAPKQYPRNALNGSEKHYTI